MWVSTLESTRWIVLVFSGQLQRGDRPFWYRRRKWDIFHRFCQQDIYGRQKHWFLQGTFLLHKTFNFISYRKKRDYESDISGNSDHKCILSQKRISFLSHKSQNCNSCLLTGFEQSLKEFYVRLVPRMAALSLEVCPDERSEVGVFGAVQLVQWGTASPGTARLNRNVVRDGPVGVLLHLPRGSGQVVLEGSPKTGGAGRTRISHLGFQLALNGFQLRLESEKKMPFFSINVQLKCRIV